MRLRVGTARNRKAHKLALADRFLARDRVRRVPKTMTPLLRAEDYSGRFCRENMTLRGRS